MSELYCDQCKSLSYRPKSYCKPFCKQTGENIMVDVDKDKPHWCPKEARAKKLEQQKEVELKQQQVMNLS